MNLYVCLPNGSSSPILKLPLLTSWRSTISDQPACACRQRPRLMLTFSLSRLWDPESLTSLHTLAANEIDWWWTSLSHKSSQVASVWSEEKNIWSNWKNDVWINEENISVPQVVLGGLVCSNEENDTKLLPPWLRSVISQQHGLARFPSFLQSEMSTQHKNKLLVVWSEKMFFNMWVIKYVVRDVDREHDQNFPEKSYHNATNYCLEAALPASVHRCNLMQSARIFSQLVCIRCSAGQEQIHHFQSNCLC